MESTDSMNKEVTVKGYRYLLGHPPVEIAWDVGIELTKMIGEPVSKLAVASGDPDSAVEAFSGSVSSFLQKVDPKTSYLLAKKILMNVECLGAEGESNRKMLMTPDNIKLHFQGRIGALLGLLGETIAFTHNDFFDAIVDGVATMMKKASEKVA